MEQKLFRVFLRFKFLNKFKLIHICKNRIFCFNMECEKMCYVPTILWCPIWRSISFRYNPFFHYWADVGQQEKREWWARRRHLIPRIPYSFWSMLSPEKHLRFLLLQRREEAKRKVNRLFRLCIKENDPSIHGIHISNIDPFRKETLRKALMMHLLDH